MRSIGIASAVLLAACQGHPRDLVLVVTTTVQDTGLADALRPRLEAATGAHIKMIAVGSGEALRMGRAGDADVLVAHAPAEEEQFMREGHGVRRLRLMTNEFVVVGPPDDPAGVAAAGTVDDAFSRIASKGSLFVSRGDRSGTNLKELSVWKRLHLEPNGKWYLVVGVGQGGAVRLAAERHAYMLVDRSTFVAQRIEPALKILFSGGTAEMTNIYSVIEVRQPTGHEERARPAAALVDALTGPEIQRQIATFGADRFGAPLFRAASG